MLHPVLSRLYHSQIRKMGGASPEGRETGTLLVQATSKHMLAGPAVGSGR